MKKISSAAIIIHNNKILICKANNHDRWDFPKGCIEEDESLLNAAIREAYEETGITLKIEECIRTFPPVKYQKGKKDLSFSVFVLKDNTGIPDELACISTYEYKGMEFKEVDKYKWIAPAEIENFLYFSILDVLCKDTSSVMSLVNYSINKKECTIENFGYAIKDLDNG